MSPFRASYPPIAGAGPQSPGEGDGTGKAATFRSPESIAVTSDGTVYVGDGGNLLLRRITGSTVQTVTVSIL